MPLPERRLLSEMRNVSPEDAHDATAFISRVLLGKDTTIPQPVSRASPGRPRPSQHGSAARLFAQHDAHISAAEDHVRELIKHQDDERPKLFQQSPTLDEDLGITAQLREVTLLMEQQLRDAKREAASTEARLRAQLQALDTELLEAEGLHNEALKKLSFVEKDLQQALQEGAEKDGLLKHAQQELRGIGELSAQCEQRGARVQQLEEAAEAREALLEDVYSKLAAAMKQASEGRQHEAALGDELEECRAREQLLRGKLREAEDALVRCEAEARVVAEGLQEGGDALVAELSAEKLRGQEREQALTDKLLEAATEAVAAEGRAAREREQGEAREQQLRERVLELERMGTAVQQAACAERVELEATVTRLERAVHAGEEKLAAREEKAAWELQALQDSQVQLRAQAEEAQQALEASNARVAQMAADEVAVSELRLFAARREQQLQCCCAVSVAVCTQRAGLLLLVHALRRHADGFTAGAVHRWVGCVVVERARALGRLRESQAESRARPEEAAGLLGALEHQLACMDLELSRLQEEGESEERLLVARSSELQEELQGVQARSVKLHWSKWEQSLSSKAGKSKEAAQHSAQPAVPFGSALELLTAQPGESTKHVSKGDEEPVFPLYLRPLEEGMLHDSRDMQPPNWAGRGLSTVQESASVGSERGQMYSRLEVDQMAGELQQLVSEAESSSKQLEELHQSVSSLKEDAELSAAMADVDAVRHSAQLEKQLQAALGELSGTLADLKLVKEEAAAERVMMQNAMERVARDKHATEEALVACTRQAVSSYHADADELLQLQLDCGVNYGVVTRLQQSLEADMYESDESDY